MTNVSERDLNVKVKKQGIYFKANNMTVSMGNGKLDKSILIFNLPSVVTCPVCKDCAKKCYARKFEKLYPVVKTCRDKNHRESLLDTFVDTIAAVIEKAQKWGATAFRIHESGDFYSMEYARKWEEIAQRFPKMKFFAYTKSPYRPTGKNINIVESILPDGSINFGIPEFVQEKAYKFGYPVCPATIKEKADKTTCGKNCKLCQKVNHVLFNVH